MSCTLSPWLAATALLLACQGHATAAAAADVPADRSAKADDQTPADQTPADHESQMEVEQQRMLERLQKEHDTEQSSVAAIRETADYQEARAFGLPAGAGKILAFHPLADGGLVVATGARQGYGEQTLTRTVAALLGFAGSKPQHSPANQLVWLDAAGEPRHKVPLPFASRGVTVASDGAVIAVGDDRVVIFSPSGELVADKVAPHFTLTADELSQLRDEIAEQHREQLEAMRQTHEMLDAARVELEKVPEEERSRRQKRELANAQARIRSLEASAGRLRVPPDDAVDRNLTKARTIHRVAASRDHLFLVANEPAGHAFGVWRCGRDFSVPEKIIGGLSGCCGQMDVQVVGDELVIAENGRHHVAVYSFDGEPLRTFGEGSRTDIRKGFGGCCNPMNACTGPDGTLLLSESNGLVKQFTADGTLVKILGAADVRPGCKNSSIGFSTDGATLYYLDIERGRVLVLEKKS